MYSLRLTNIEAENGPGKTIFIYKQGGFHFYVSESECMVPPRSKVYLLCFWHLVKPLATPLFWHVLSPHGGSILS